MEKKATEVWENLKISANVKTFVGVPPNVWQKFAKKGLEISTKKKRGKKRNPQIWKSSESSLKGKACKNESSVKSGGHENLIAKVGPAKMDLWRCWQIPLSRNPESKNLLQVKKGQKKKTWAKSTVKIPRNRLEISALSRKSKIFSRRRREQKMSRSLWGW